MTIKGEWPRAQEHLFFYIGIYVAIRLAGASNVAAFRTSRTLFKQLLTKVVHATIRWHDITPQGRLSVVVCVRAFGMTGLTTRCMLNRFGNVSAAGWSFAHSIFATGYRNNRCAFGKLVADCQLCACGILYSR